MNHSQRGHLCATVSNNAPPGSHAEASQMKKQHHKDSYAVDLLVAPIPYSGLAQTARRGLAAQSSPDVLMIHRNESAAI